MEVTVVSSSGRTIAEIDSLPAITTVKGLKERIHLLKKGPYAGRQLLRLEPKGKPLDDNVTLASTGFKSGGKVYLKDLGPQISWTTVFLCEYAGPLFVYLWVYTRPWLFYGDGPLVSKPYAPVVHLAAGCYAFHYTKRLLETVFVHRFSHATMPIRNLFKNCSYYWGFTAYVAYHVNHPLYTPPCQVQVYVAAAIFLLCELGNLSVHLLFRDLRPPGSKVRKIPQPNWNPFNLLFNFVSCPNYTYEFGAWLAFTVMTQCLPAGLFAVAGMAQMSIWALGKHRAYKKEFPTYPKGRKAILPFLL